MLHHLNPLHWYTQVLVLFLVTLYTMSKSIAQGNNKPLPFLFRERPRQAMSNDIPDHVFKYIKLFPKLSNNIPGGPLESQGKLFHHTQ